MPTNDTIQEYRRNLPHIQPKGAMFFITFRLFNSIPMAKLEQFKRIYETTHATDIYRKPVKQLKELQQEEYFQALDDFLDMTPNGPYYLANHDTAKMVCESIKYRDGKEYKLVCFCIMSNHVHLIIYKLIKPLHTILKELKSFTAKEAFKILKDSEFRTSFAKKSCSDEVTGQFDISKKTNRAQQPFHKFWQPESFDRIIRDRNDMAEKIKYTLNNPVKAGLVTNWRSWKWSYCRPEFSDC